MARWPEKGQSEYRSLRPQGHAQMSGLCGPHFWGFPTGPSFVFTNGAVAGASARPRGISRPASGCGMEPSLVHADAGEYDTAFSCPEHILVEYLSAYILCCGICLQPDVYYDMMGIAMELQAAPLSIESGSSNELARGVGGRGIKY